MPQAPRPDLPEGPVADAATDPLQRGVRELLSLASLSRTTLARRLGMSVHDVAAVEHVMTTDDALGPVELSRRLGVTSAAATQSVDRLEAAGHVRRTADPADGRRKVVEVTPEGASAVFAQLAPLLAGAARAGDGMSPQERDVVVRYLDRLAEAYRAFLAEPVTPPRAPAPGRAGAAARRRPPRTG